VHDLRSRRVVVTGGAGFIGSHLCDALVAGGYDVTCVDNLAGTSGSTANVAHLLGEPRFRLRTESILDWIESADLTEVGCLFHLAASKHAVSMADPERDLTVNGLGTLRLLLKAAEHEVPKFVHASTGSVFGETVSAHSEDGPKKPVSFYGVSKLTGESYCRVVDETFGLDCTVLRYYHVIGPRQGHSEGTGGVLPIFVRRCLEGRPLTIFGTGMQTRCFTSVHDVVRVTLLAAQSERMRHQVFNCASGVSVTIQELAEFVIAVTGSDGGIEYAAARLGDIDRFTVDNAKLRALGVDFDTDWQSVVRQVVASFETSEAPKGRISAPM
jgi:UDP-glucose 4-epimerase